VDKINSLTGMMDLLASKTNKEELANKIFYTEKVLLEIFDNFKISQIRTPSLEHTNLFERSVGNSSDIVNKELYTFFDKNDRSITLRPEGTASVIRSLIEKKLDGDFHKLWYLGSMWRYERPQMGRYRQFNQAGVEILGYKEGMAEFEMISMVCSINHRLRIEKPTIKINHLGDNETKKNFCDALIEYLKPIKSQLDEKDLFRLEKNPLRILDSKSPQTIELLKDGPNISEFLKESSLKIMDLIVDTFSDECEIQIDHNLVRGLDYYTGFVFEAISSNLGAQDAYLGGGRYDNLCKQLGGKDLPAIGMAIGIERLSLLSNVLEESKTSISLIIISSNIEPKAYKIAHNLRSLNNNINVDVQLSDGSLKSKLRRANKDNSSYAIIIGEEELGSDSVIVKSLSDDDSEQTIMKMNDFNNFIKNLK
jgi:histidyl-tRNA synthetase